MVKGSLPQPSVATKAPTPTQSGIAADCIAWYQTTSEDDDCDLIPQFFGTFSKADFLKWNPALGPSCAGLVIGNYYCVATPLTPKTRTTSASPTSLPTNGVGPQPEQPGIPSNCAKYWFVGTWVLLCDYASCLQLHTQYWRSISERQTVRLSLRRTT